MLRPWLSGRNQLICLGLSISILHSWTFQTKPMPNMKPEITIYWLYDTHTDEQLKFSAWHFDIKRQPCTNFWEHQDMLALHMASFTSLLVKCYVLPPLWSCLWHFMHTVLLLLYIKKHYLLENTSKYRDPTFRPWWSPLFLFTECTL